MTKRIMLIPVGSSVGLTSVSLGLVRALEQKNMNVGFFKPISQPKPGELGPEKSSEIIKRTSNILPPKPFDLAYAAKKFSEGEQDILLEDIVGRFEAYAQKEQTVIIEGLVQTQKQNYTVRLNAKVASALSADVIFVTTYKPQEQSCEEMLELAAQNYGGLSDDKVLGVIFNKVGAPNDPYDLAAEELENLVGNDLATSVADQIKQLSLFKKTPFKLLGVIPWDLDLVAPRVKDLASYINAKILNAGDIEHRRLRSVHFCARTVANMLAHFTPNSLLVTPGDRTDVIIAACLAVMNGTKLGAILLTGDFTPDENILQLCNRALESGLPLLLSNKDTWHTALELQRFNFEVPVDDFQRIEKVKDHTATYIDKTWIDAIAASTHENKKSPAMSPPAFRYMLAERARKANKTIVLPEGNEPRTIKAAAICGERKIAHTVLLGDREEILSIAANQGIELNDYVTIVEPATVIDKYIEHLVALRKHKGLTEVMAREQLEDTVVLGTMMLARNQVDGLVSGAVNTTANTIRPPLQLIKTADNCSLVSSVFFMLLPEQVFVYGDCAINPDPNAEQLADIAIQSADSAKAFGIEPRVAMISYSTGSSGQGEDVEKVRKATEIAKAKRPDILLDGPLQYDAAVMANVAKKKAPDSPVAGRANVFIFPDLNTGNTTYKAVQRSADLISIGPMLQGMKKPVNDLSRGALVEDIVYTIALTAIQAGQVQ